MVMMPNTCQKCQHWIEGRYCGNAQSPRSFRLVGAGCTCLEFRRQSTYGGFASFVADQCPVKGLGRGRRKALSRACGHVDMIVLHWVRGHSSPGPELVDRIAEFFDVAPERIEAMILVDVRARAERVWRSGAKRKLSASAPAPASPG